MVVLGAGKSKSGDTFLCEIKCGAGHNVSFHTVTVVVVSVVEVMISWLLYTCKLQFSLQ